MHITLFFFPEKKIIEKNCVPTLPKIFRPVTLNTLIFYLALSINFNVCWGLIEMVLLSIYSVYVLVDK